MECDGCTLCCELLNIPWMDSPPGELCKHCNGTGCDIYDTAPKDCLLYECAYVQMDKASIIFNTKDRTKKVYGLNIW